MRLLNVLEPHCVMECMYVCAVHVYHLCVTQLFARSSATMTYLSCLERGLEDSILSRVLAQNGGPLIKVAIVEAGFERVTTQACDMNKMLLLEFKALDPKFRPLPIHEI